MTDTAAQLAALRATATEVRTEWTATTTHTDGTRKRQPAEDDEAHIAMVADSIAYHLSTLNEETREYKGITGVAIELREVFTLADGTTVIGPWQHVRDGNPQHDEEASRG